MENVRCDMLVVTRDKPSGALVQHNQAWRLGSANLLVGFIHTRAGVQVKIIAVDENRTMRCVMGPNTGAAGQIEAPEDVRLAGLAGRLEAKNLAPIAH